MFRQNGRTHGRTDRHCETNMCSVYSSFNSLPIAALYDVTNSTTQRPMEIFPSKPRARCNVVPQMTHRVHRIYRVRMHTTVFFMKMKRTVLEMSIKYSGTKKLVSNAK